MSLSPSPGYEAKADVPFGPGIDITAPRSMPTATKLFQEMKVAKKPTSTNHEEEINLQARAESASRMASEVSVEVATPKCVVHKGPITGFSYICKTCGTVYCMKCVRHLAAINEPCWTCKQPLDVSSFDQTAELDEAASMSVLSEDIIQRLQDLNLPDEILDEVLGSLKSIPPEERIKFLDDTFADSAPFDGKF